MSYCKMSMKQKHTGWDRRNQSKCKSTIRVILWTLTFQSRFQRAQSIQLTLKMAEPFSTHPPPVPCSAEDLIKIPRVAFESLMKTLPPCYDFSLFYLWPFYCTCPSKPPIFNSCLRLHFSSLNTISCPSSLLLLNMNGGWWGGGSL